ncbi:MAG TPA: type II toxin-antitoxin system prevent-host-death family antitoxin [Pseudonocardiaceae bacterium]|jgi:prevent-host-death family protein|nr:type II toxin-antitoxin system prevent-host-death family antitoxin [Pseudonocardiaceae bacterium]
MDRIPIRELNQHTSAVLARVQHGEPLEVTVNGHAIARLVPVEPSELDDLVARGRITLATSSGPIQRPTGPVDTSIDSTDIISELREERW